MPDDVKDKVIDRIRKLMNIAKNDAASEGDIQAAVNAAQRLMERHHLQESDLAHGPEDDYKRVDAAEKGRYRAWLGRKVWLWENWLASFTADFVGCGVYLDFDLHTARNHLGFLVLDVNDNPIKTKSVVFYGVAEDALIATEVYNELRLTIQALAVGRYGSFCTGPGAGYAEGFVVGMKQALLDGREKEKLLAHRNGLTNGTTQALLVIARRDDLVQYKKTAAQKYRDDLGLHLRKGDDRDGQHTRNRDAFKRGLLDGRKQEVSAARNKKLM